MNTALQKLFFERVKQRADPKFSLVDEVADLLEVSNDSAYRRLRGETALSLDEAFAIAKHFGIGLEEISKVNSDMVLFGRSTFRDQGSDFESYLLKTQEYLSRIAQTKERRGIYAAKDIPVFHYFQIPEFGQFKLFFWLKTIRSSNAIDDSKFSFNSIPADMVKKAAAIAKTYFQIPFKEIWNEDTINTALRQIDYFNEAGWLANKEVALQLCRHFNQMIVIIQEQAETGLRKFDDKLIHPDVSFELYLNDLVVLDNSIFVETDQFLMSMIGYNSIDFLYTSHEGFCREAQNFLEKQLSKSMLLSGAAEKERNKFFNRIYAKVEVLEQKIKSS